MTLLTAMALMLTAVLCAEPLSRRLGRNTGYVMAAFFLSALGVLLLSARDVLDSTVVTGQWQWITSLDIALRLHLDGLSLVFSILVLGVGALIMSYCPRYLNPVYDHGRLYTLLALFATAMLGMVLSSDLIVLYVFFEVTTICSFFLIGGRGMTQHARPATRAYVVTASGGLSLLGAVVLLWMQMGTTDLAQILLRADEVTASPYAPWIGGLIIYAALTKSAQFPFHFWLPDAMVALTPVSAYLHAATLVKAGIYLLMRFSEPFTGFTWWTVSLVSIGITTAVIGAVFALQQHDLKALLAYSTVSQLGWIVSLIGVGTEHALGAAGLHTFSHALFKATLFMLVGVIDREAGSRDIRELSGLYRVMPFTAAATAMAAMSMAGLPPFLGFVSKEESYYAFLQLDGGWAVGAIAVAAAAITFAYSVRLVYGAFAGPTTQTKLYDASWSFLTPAAVPAVTGLVLGLGAGWLNPLFDQSVQATVLDPSADAGLGLLPESITSPALWMTIATVSIGLVLFIARDPVDRALQRLVLPFNGVRIFDAGYDAVLRFCSAVGRPARSGAVWAHVAWPLGVLVAVGLAVLVLTPGLTPADFPLPPASRPEDWVVVTAVALAALGLCLTFSRLGAIALLGMIGFLLAAWFLLVGGVDLAMTQMLVEILTVAVAVLVLRRLPRRFEKPGRRRRRAALAAAVVSGLTLGAATLLLTGRHEPSPAAGFYAEQGAELAGGTNLVNTILVDFRGLDTFGEITVLAVAAIGLLALLRGDADPDTQTRRMDLPGDRTVLTAARQLLVPAIAVLALWLMWRGHDEPGGGFVAALAASLAVVVAMLPRSAGRPRRITPAGLIATGLIVAVASGVVGLLEGSFLRPLQGTLQIGGFEQSLTTSLIFDLGVFFTVVGLVVAALDRFTYGKVPEPDGATKAESRTPPAPQNSGGDRP